MPDITMCKDSECPRAYRCFRYTARTDRWSQSYFLESPRQADNSCALFYPSPGNKSKGGSTKTP